MGYFCATEAADTLKIIQEEILKTAAPNSAINEIPLINGFWEIGKENHDGAITGSVYRPCKDTPNAVKRSGTFRIEADGTLTRFYGLTGNQKHIIECRILDAKHRKNLSRGVLNTPGVA